MSGNISGDYLDDASLTRVPTTRAFAPVKVEVR
jgi:hypothetical protein